MIRAYTEADLESCLALFDSNCPEYLDPSERADYAEFLTTKASQLGYLVVEGNGQVIGAGGLMVSENIGWFCWGLVDNARHKAGIGTRLVHARLDQARENANVKVVKLDTSQKTVGFYERFGFVTDKINKDGYGPGLDRYDMTLTV